MVEALPSEDPQPQIARAVVNEGYNLLEVKALGMSLEDIFLELTREDDELIVEESDLLEDDEERDLDLDDDEVDELEDDDEDDDNDDDDEEDD
jgi:hypothetical protein